MAADFETVNRNKQLGNSLVRLAGLLREVRELTDFLHDIGQHSFDDGDYTVFETNFGLTSGRGANVLYLVGLVNEILNTDATVAGDARQARLNEFVSRLAGQ